MYSSSSPDMILNLILSNSPQFDIIYKNYGTNVYQISQQVSGGNMGKDCPACLPFSPNNPAFSRKTKENGGQLSFDGQVQLNHE
jgi:hypothetical protein